jgi:hypothetical protein
MSWSIPIVSILQKIRYNSIQLNTLHTQRYLALKQQLILYDLPIICFSIFSASFSNLGVVPPVYTTMIVTLISMGIAMLSSTKLYLSLDKNINLESELATSYYILSINIYKILKLTPTDLNARVFLDESFAEYSGLIQQSTIMLRGAKIDLLTINDDFDSDTGSIRSVDSFNILTDENEI